MDTSDVSILIVDDEAEILSALQTHFEMDGYPVETASSAREALDKIRSQAYQVVYTDINMPGMDGLELLEEIRKIRGETLVVMITAYSTLMKVIQSRVEGAFDYILKPFRDLSEVDEVMGKAFRHLERWNRVIEATREKVKACR